MKIPVTNIRVRVTAQYRRDGSVLAGTVISGCESIRTELHLDSEEPTERVRQLVRMAEASCFTIGALRNPTPCELVAVLNDQRLDMEVVQ